MLVRLSSALTLTVFDSLDEDEQYFASVRNDQVCPAAGVSLQSSAWPCFRPRSFWSCQCALSASAALRAINMLIDVHYSLLRGSDLVVVRDTDWLICIPRRTTFITRRRSQYSERRVISLMYCWISCVTRSALDDWILHPEKFLVRS